MKFVLIVLVLLTLSCKSQNGLDVTDKDQDTGLTLLVEDNYFFTDAMVTIVIRDEKTLKSFFSRVNSTRKPGIPVPEVNFKEEIVLVVCAGEQRTATIPHLKLITSNAQETTIGVDMDNKSKDGDASVSYPLAVYKMPIIDSKVSFIKL